MPRTHKSLLTPHGKRLLQFYRDWNNGRELTPDQFIREVIVEGDDDMGICLRCEEYKMLIGRAFCTRCLSGYGEVT